MKSTRTQLLLIAIVAVAHAAFYIWYQQPDWNRAWTDQGGYRLLAKGLNASGRFTRYPDATPFVPEAIRTPGYPLFVAAVFRAAGEHHMAVAVAQAALFVLICLMVFGIARRITTPRGAIAAAAVTACFPPLPYFGALVMTELWTTFVLTGAILATMRALERSSGAWFAFAGFCYGYTALSRPVFILLAPFLVLASIPLLWRGSRWTHQARQWAIVLVFFTATVLPWFVYNYRHFGAVTISAAGGLGRPIWESSWQGIWAGRVQAELTDLAFKPTSDSELNGDVERLAAAQHLDAKPMLDYVRQWRDIRRIWTTPEEPEERSRARIVGDRTYRSVGLSNIRRAPVAYLTRRATRGLFVLWAAEIPVRYTQIATLPPLLIRFVWLPQIVLVGLGAVGLTVLYRHGDYRAVLLVGGPLLYVTAVHFLLLTEARQSLPVKPLLIIAAVSAFAAMPRSARAKAESPATAITGSAPAPRHLR